MKKILILSMLISQAIISFSQELKTKKKKTNEQEGAASFYLLASNDSIKQGEYQIKAYTGNRILLKGNYDNNKRIGFWQEQYYGKEYKGPKASGYYNNGIKTGEWTYFNYKGDTAQVYNWTENKIVFSKICGQDSKEYTIIENGNERKSKLDCPPSCVTGQDYFLYEFVRDIGEQSMYFKKTANNISQLKTKITITIDKNASISDISFSTDEKSELKDIIRKYIESFRWLPGKKDGQFITSKYEFSVVLSIQG